MGTVRSWIIGTTAPAGSGKTFRRCAHFLFNEFLPDTSGPHWSNFPVKPDVICAALAEKTGRPVEEFLARVKVIPEEELKKWRMQESGPWDFFGSRDCDVCNGKKTIDSVTKDGDGKVVSVTSTMCGSCGGKGVVKAAIDLSGARIAIDEFHKYCPSQAKAAWRKKWGEWFGEIRHRNASVEIISQNPRKVAREVWDEAGTRLVMNNSENRRDPFFRIPLSDWYELRASWLTGRYLARVWEIEKREVDGKWITEDSRSFTLDPFYFPFYDSYNRPDDASAKAEAEKHVFQSRSKLGVLFWFVKRNTFRLFTRLAIGGFILFMMFGGGGSMLRGWNAAFMHMMKFQGTGKNHTLFDPGTAHSLSGSAAGVLSPVSGSGPSTRPTTRPARATTLPAEDVEALYKQLDDEKSKERKYQEMFDRMGEIVVIWETAVTFRDGSTYAIGERISAGPYSGTKVKEIHYREMRVVLDDGRVLGLSRRM